MTKANLSLFAAGIVSLLAFATPDLASADARSRQRDLDRAATRSQSSRLNELQRDRAELRRDQAELERDRADLARLQRSGASRQEIERKREEIRRDLKELAQDHREVSDSLEALSGNSYRGSGWDTNVWQRDRLSRNDTTDWGWGRRDDRDRRGRNDTNAWGWGRRDDRSRGRVADRWGWGHGRD